jgi:hypothetical protein
LALRRSSVGVLFGVRFSVVAAKADAEAPFSRALQLKKGGCELI